VLFRSPGDFIETGVWRGGASIFMRGVLKVYGIKNRVIYVVDSFEGLPEPDIEHYPEDIEDKLYIQKAILGIPMEEVQGNFRKYDLYDKQVVFIKGWFKDTLQTRTINKLAILRLDGDMFESTMDALVPLYPKLSIGGYIIVDDYYNVDGCKKAIDKYRADNLIIEPICEIDGNGIYWRKEHRCCGS
jgi:O-methyltransferase